MNTTITPTTLPAVRFGATHGYRFVADEAELNATFHIAGRAAHDRTWALQLWACPSVPVRSDDLVGHLVAEAALPPIAEIAGEAEAFAVTAPAQPPAGDRDHSMVLVLAARSGGGDFNEVHDVVSFPMRERFLLPRLAGPVAFRVEGSRVHVAVNAIENPRDATNTSGTIALELWALPAPYSGGRFSGAPLAGAILGTLAGQDRWSGLALDLPFTPASAGQSHVVMMVREWTGAGYTTRDFANLGTWAATTPPAAPKPAFPAAGHAAVLAAPAVPVVSTTTAMVAPDAKTRPTTSPDKISLNTAALAQLLSVKGLPRAVAERILRDRPFKSVEDVLQVKGMGEKLLGKIRDRLTL